jgi:hypothetical protein
MEVPAFKVINKNTEIVNNFFASELFLVDNEPIILLLPFRIFYNYPKIFVEICIYFVLSEPLALNYEQVY